MELVYSSLQSSNLISQLEGSTARSPGLLQGAWVGHDLFLLSQQFSTHTLCMAFLAGLFLGLCLVLFADTAATQSLGEVLPIK